MCCRSKSRERSLGNVTVLKKLKTPRDPSHYAVERGDKQYHVQWRTAKPSSRNNNGFPRSQENSCLNASSSREPGLDLELEEIHDSLKK